MNICKSKFLLRVWLRISKDYSLIVVICALALGSSAQAQEKRVLKVLNEVYSSIVQNSHNNIDESVLFKPGNEAIVLDEMEAWLTDTLRDVRQQAISYTGIVGLKTTEAAIKQNAVQLLVQSINNKDEALDKSAIRYLTRFTRRDFTKDVCDSIRATLHRSPSSFSTLVRLVGFLDLKDQITYLDSVYSSVTLPNSTRWNIKLSLARMGDSNSVEYCLRLAKKAPVDDNFIYHALPDLIYTRQKAVYDYLLETLYSDETNCNSPNPYYSAKISCGYGVMEALAPVVSNFPFKTNSSGEIVTDNYEKALNETRKWFQEHKADYELKMDTY